MVLMEFFAKNCRFEVPNPVKQGGYISHYSIRFTVVMFTIGSWWFNPSNRLTRLCIKQRTTSACPLQHATNKGVRPAIFGGFAEVYYTEDLYQAKNYHVEALWCFQFKVYPLPAKANPTPSNPCVNHSAPNIQFDIQWSMLDGFRG